MLLALAIGVMFVAAVGRAEADRRPRDSHAAFFLVEPGVYGRRVACTTEPAPAAPIVTVRRSPRARLRLRVTGDGALCQAAWAATRGGRRLTDLTLTATPRADEASVCGTCVIDLLITRLGRGDYTVTLGPTTIRAHAP